MNKKALYRALLVAFGASMLPAHAVLAPNVDDTYIITTNRPDQNTFGGQPTLKVAPGVYSMMRFDFATLPAGVRAGDVAKATMMLSIQKVDRAGLVDIYPLIAPSTWTEELVTGLYTGTAIATSVPVSAESHFIILDVTQQVKAWLGGAKNLGVLVLPSASAPQTAVQFDSREAGGPTPTIDVTLFDHRGASILTGSGAPSDELGEDGDFYFDTLRALLIGPRVNGHWPLTPVTLGPSGPKGDAGPAGPQGAPGLQGAAGPQGAVGVQGPIGLAGPAGPIGLTGPTGAQGPAGAAGAQGAAGAAGPQGPVGAQGASGAQGPAGAAGAQGAAGVAGPQGPVGAQGAAGAQGPIGPQGAMGLGIPGVPGATGAQGPEGPQGPAGNQGPQGAQGAQGAQGSAVVGNTYIETATQSRNNPHGGDSVSVTASCGTGRLLAGGHDVSGDMAKIVIAESHPVATLGLQAGSYRVTAAATANFNGTLTATAIALCMP